MSGKEETDQERTARYREVWDEWSAKPENGESNWKQKNYQKVLKEKGKPSKCANIFAAWQYGIFDKGVLKSPTPMGDLPPELEGKEFGLPIHPAVMDSRSAVVTLANMPGMDLHPDYKKQNLSRRLGDHKLANEIMYNTFKRNCSDDFDTIQKDYITKAYNEFKAQSLFEETAAKDLAKAGKHAVEESRDCAEKLNEAIKVDLLPTIETFWKDPLTALIFEDGFDFKSLRRTPTPPPTAASIIDKNVEADLAATEANLDDGHKQSDPDDYIDEFETSDSYGALETSEAVLSEAEVASKIVGEVASSTYAWKDPQKYPSYMISGEVAHYWDHVLIDSGARAKLKTYEFMEDAMKVSPSPMPKKADVFPHLYASLLFSVFNRMEVIAKTAPTDNEIKDFIAGKAKASIPVYEKAALVSSNMSPADVYLSPPNSPGSGYSTKAVIVCAQMAAIYLTAYDPSEERDKWIALMLKTMLGIAENIQTNADCIKKAKDDYDNKKDSIVASLGAAIEGLDKSWWNDWLHDEEALQEALEKHKDVLDDAEIDDFGWGTPAEKKLFKEQCFLLAFAARIADYKRGTLDYYENGAPKSALGIHKRIPYATLGEKVKQEPFAKNNIKDVDGAFNASLQVSGKPFGFINKLTQSPNYSTLIDIPHWQLSALQPKIRLFKVAFETDAKGVSTEAEIEIKFNSHFSKTELDDIYKGMKTRSAGMGLKNFEFTYDGSNPFAAKKSIKAKLSLFASSFSELFYERDGAITFKDKKGALANESSKDYKGSKKYRYIDLALKTANNPGNMKGKDWPRILEENAQLAKLNFRLKAVVGWSVPPGKIPGMNSDDKKKLKSALADSFVTLNLTPTVHNFSFDQQGRVVFDINYLAYVEDFFDERAFNVFADPTGKVGFQREVRRLKMRGLTKKCNSAEEEETKKALEAAQGKYKEEVKQEIKDSLSSLIKSMMFHNKIYYIGMKYEQIQNFVAHGPYKEYKGYVTTGNEDFIKNNSENNAVLSATISAALAQAGQEEEAGEGGPNNSVAAHMTSGPASNQLSFFYLSDLVDVVLENIQSELGLLQASFDKNRNDTTVRGTGAAEISKEDWDKRRKDLGRYNDNFKRLRVLLGPVELVHHGKESAAGPSVFINFGDIPISVKYFMEWIACKVLSKDEIFYSLSVFLNQLMNNLVTNFLNSNKCFFDDIKQKIRVNQSVITAYSPDGGDELTHLIKKKAMKPTDGSIARLSLTEEIVTKYMSNGTRPSRPLLNISGRGGERHSEYAPLSFETNYLVFFAGRVASSNSAANRDRDTADGIFHYVLGRDRGLVKQIQLKKTQTAGLAEARFEQDGYDGLQQLRVIYDLDIETYANVNTFPGTYIYVPPGGLDPAFKTGNFGIDLTQLGIGGYYMIIRSSHSFGSGEASTKIYAKWVNSLDAEYPQNSGVAGKNEKASEGSCTASAERLTKAEQP